MDQSTAGSVPARAPSGGGGLSEIRKKIEAQEPRLAALIDRIRREGGRLTYLEWPGGIIGALVSPNEAPPPRFRILESMQGSAEDFVPDSKEELAKWKAGLDGRGKFRGGPRLARR